LAGLDLDAIEIADTVNFLSRAQLDVKRICYGELMIREDDLVPHISLLLDRALSQQAARKTQAQYAIEHQESNEATCTIIIVRFRFVFPVPSFQTELRALFKRIDVWERPVSGREVELVNPLIERAIESASIVDPSIKVSLFVLFCFLFFCCFADLIHSK
jgi:hypothetical protein